MTQNFTALTNEEDFRVRFGGELHEIDSNTLVNYLLNLNTIIGEVNREIEPERKINVKIKALSQGSFEVAIQLQSIFDQLKSIFSMDDAGYIANLLAIISSLYAARLLLKGKAPAEVKKDGDTVTITNSNGNTLTMTKTSYHIYNTNKPINLAITKQFETLDADPNIESLNITNKEDKPLLSVEHNEFPDIATPNEQLEVATTHEIREKAILSVVKLSFDPRLVSDFVYMNIRISAYIKDKDFYQRIDRGEPFSKGDALEVKLQVNKQFDASLNTDIIKNYEVIQVLRHIPRSDPGQLTIDMTIPNVTD